MTKSKRSPKFPFIDLETAINRARVFYNNERRQSAAVPIAVDHWGYKPKTSGGLQTIGALKGYGLLEDEGSKDARRVKLTQRALQILLDEREDSSERRKIIKEAALSPALFKELWEKWKDGLPSEGNMRHFLIFDKDFNENTAGDFIRVFTNTVRYAGLDGSDNIDDKIKFTEGDYIQWESQGVLQLTEPRLVTGVSEDGEYLFVEGSSTGIPMSEAIPQTDVQSKGGNSPPKQPPPSFPGMNQEVFPVEEGDIVLRWPKKLGADSFEYMESWLNLILKKARRTAGLPEPDKPSEKS